MPSLPTSLIFVGLVVAWLVVLVPMVAKRREYVPDHEDEPETYRVLEARPERTRRRPVFSRSVAGIDAEPDPDSARDELEAYDDGDRFEDERGDGADVAGSDFEVTGSGVTGFGAGEGTDRRAVTVDVGGERRRVDETIYDVSAAAPVREPAAGTRIGGRDGGRDGGSDDARGGEPRSGRGGGRGEDRAGFGRVDGDDERYRPVPVPVPVRPGRGGFDPEAADRVQQQRYRQRRTVALVLAAVAAIGAVLAVFGVGGAWIASTSGAVLLVLYLAYLRRQVHIEREIRARRMARLERARQIRPAYRPSVADQLRAHRTGEFARPGSVPEGTEEYRVVSHARPSVPPQYLPGAVPVAFDDDDPAFSDLDYYEPMPYRRAVGQ